MVSEVTERISVEEMCERYYLYVLRVIVSKVKDVDLAADLTQDAFLKAIKHFDTYRPNESSITTWLFKVAHSACNDYFRKQSRRCPSVPIEEVVDVPGWLDVQEQYESRELLVDALDQLTYKQFLCIALPVSGYSFGETAKIAGVSERTARNYRCIGRMIAQGRN